MLKLILILIGALIFEAVGVVLLSQGLREIGNVDTVTPVAVKRVVRQGITNRNILLGESDGGDDVGEIALTIVQRHIL